MPSGWWHGEWLAAGDALPGYYRDKWEEDMIAAFLDSWLNGDPEADEAILEFCRPTWPEVASVAGLAARLYLGGAGGRPRPRRPGWPGRLGLGVRRLVIRGFERAAQFRGPAPRPEHPALGLLLHPARPAQGEMPARRAQLLG